MNSRKKETIKQHQGYKRFENDLKRRKQKSVLPNISIDSNSELLHLSLPYRTSFIKFFDKKFNSIPSESKSIKVPKRLSFTSDFDRTTRTFNNLHYALFRSKEFITIDFKNCKFLSIGTGTILQIMIQNFYSFKARFNDSRYKKITKELKIKPSSHLKTNKMLFALNIIDEFEGMDELEESGFLALDLKSGSKSKSNYKENIKGRLCTEVNDFVNKSMSPSGYELQPKASKYLQNLLGEILGNAEDHSELNTYYINGVSFKEPDDSDLTIELNLCIVNYGYSFYEGFKKTEEKNIIVRDKMRRYYFNHMNILGGKHDGNFTEESLYTLYGLQEGVSRLKYDEKSRGNGTMNFIKAFINLGKFAKEKAIYKPQMNLISGHTVITCTDEYAPYEKDMRFWLSLNKEQNLGKLPDRKCIFANKESFPGTILQVKIFMNKENFSKVVKNGG
ncbi:hypothetical protein [Autumnicola psychrophila]|uniref:Uncharacterized protein n=1 Tax=Autumnicola psychrophila TaxID=3075592 RepID=A0ABU3DVB9_9FLAO|nr:hypothetical protein [Zunongwangia sp. F225]MDT0687663.1 hypothetical protein [Zunongwangia sp. F225]